MIQGTNIQWPSGVGWLQGDRGTEALGVKDVSPAVPETIVATYDFETLPPGAGTWLLDPLNPHSGLFCFRSAPILDNQSSQWTFAVPAPATSLRFWWRVSSEAGFDFFEIYKDSVTVPNRIFQQSGTSNVWAQATLSIAGATNIIIRYVKDSSSSVGLDAAFVDDMEWIVPGAAAVQNYEPLHLDPSNQVKVKEPNLDVALSTRASEATLAAFKAENDSNLDALNAVVGAFKLENEANLDQLNATVSAFKAENDSNLDSVNASLDAIEAIITQVPKFKRISAALLGDNVIVLPVVGKKIRVLNYMVTAVTAGAPVTLQWKSDTLTVLGEIVELDGLWPVQMAGSVLGPLFETNVNEPLIINLNAAKLTTGHLTYVEI